MSYRTKTYIAADWTGDQDAINQLYKWNESDHWGLHFVDAHELTQARDSSINCNIKKSLKTRLDASKKFILIVGEKTNTVTSGSCQHCYNYSSKNHTCTKGYAVDLRSYIKYECDIAVRDGIDIVVLYNSTRINKYNCIDAVKNIGMHFPMKKYVNRIQEWDYQAVKKALE